MKRASDAPDAASRETRRIATGYARGIVGGMLVGAPVLMTMEIWWEGFFVPAWRLLLLYGANFCVLLILQHYSGLTHKRTWTGQVRGAIVASGIGIVGALVVLLLLGVLHGDLTPREVAGQLLLESIPVSIGASVAMSEFGEEHRKATERRDRAEYWGSLGMSIAGAMLFGFGVSGTEEPLMIAEQLNWWRAIGLMLVSLGQVFAIVYAVDFRQRPPDAGTRARRLAMMRESVSTYALALAIGAYLLWTFRTLNADIALVPSVFTVIVIGFVTSLGAAAAELLI